MVVKAFGYTGTTEGNFPDVPAGVWYARDLQIAENAGYFQEDSNSLIYVI